MTYLPPLQPDERHLSFIWRIFSSIRYKSQAEFEKLLVCGSGGRKHKLYVRERHGEQCFECPDESCSTLPQSQRLDTDELDLVDQLVKIYRKYWLAHKSYYETVKTCNAMTYDVHSNDSIYWMSRFMYLDKKEVFMEAYEDAKEQLRIYFRRRNGVELPKEQRRIIKSTVHLTVPWREQRCRPIEDDQSEMAGTTGFTTPTQLTRSTKTTQPKRKLAEVLNEGEPRKKQWLNNINDGLRKLPSQDTSLETPSGKGKGKASSGPSPIRKLLAESATQPATPHRPTKTTASDMRDIIVVSDDD